MRNNIVANCQANYVNPEVNGAPVNTGAAFDYNLYFGNGAGPDLNGVRDDPRFVNASAGDYSIASGPAVNAGDPTTTTLQAGDTDLLGRPRFAPNGGRVDLGAVELQTSPP